MSILCRLGFHRWGGWEYLRVTEKGKGIGWVEAIARIGYRRRTCERCGKQETGC
jgi:hypothetical protein